MRDVLSWVIALSLYLICPPHVDAAAVPGSAPFINAWALLGSFDNADNSGFANDFIGEETITPRVGDSAAGKTWVYLDDRLFSRNMDDYIDLYSYYKVKLRQDAERKVTYLHTYVYSPHSLSAELRTGSNDGFKAWVNGVPAGSFADKRGARKDDTKAPVSLLAGWNRVLLKICNQKLVYGCYARICDASGNAITGLHYSVNGGSGPLALATQAMSDAAIMPKAFKDWSYVSLKSAGTHINSAQASHFYLQAQGGSPPYSWSIRSGSIPPGLTLGADGSIRGIPVRKGDYNFTVLVKDSLAAEVTKRLQIKVEDPPSQAYLESNFGSLMHDPGYTVVDGQVVPNPDDVPAKTVAQMKKEGYQYVIPVAGGTEAPKWPAPGHEGAPDWITPFYQEAMSQGLKFGFYYSIYNGYYTTMGYADPIDHIVGDIDDAITRYHPLIFWFDEAGKDASGEFHRASDITENREYDALHSLIKARNPAALVIMNDGYGPEDYRTARGDMDVLEFEGSHSDWIHFPESPPADDKKMPIESWRFPAKSAWPGVTWQEAIQQVAALIGNGFIANLDHSPNANVPGLHQSIEAWMTPKGLPPRAPSLTNTRRSPLKEGDWGYSRMSLEGDKIYLHIFVRPNHKTGMPGGSTLTVGPVTKRVVGVRVLNDDAARSYSQNQRELAIDIEGIQVDPVDTIIEITLNTAAQ